ncbi:vomeronasal type-1 receptor 2-like [Carlito syrichta]|uniref:Vomeronasal type-1 receptor n=1 Tax=Carlito syrichta TaxID=1868482 RepID=A0A3Q0EGV7_CARSF|nr:vomeronasal type-1 receptor 2-like [Carlito syrichta]
MASVDLKFGMIFLSQVVVGILGNFSLLYHYMSLYFRGCGQRSTDLILRHLTVANSLVILSRGIPETMAALGLRHFAIYFGCNVLLYVHRVARGVSIGATCLLSVFQMITINPNNSSRWVELKAKAPKYVGPTSILCWALQLLVNIIFPIYKAVNLGNKNITNNRNFGYCHAPFYDEVVTPMYAALTSLHDVLCLSLMTWASSSMVFILHRHRQQVQRIHRKNHFHRSSPETRATQSILALVSTFVTFYALSFSIYVYLAVFNKSNWWLMNIAVVITACFPTISPFVLMRHELTISSFYCICCQKATQFSYLIRTM